MLFLASVACLILFALTNVAVLLVKRPGVLVVPTCLVFLLGPLTIGLLIPALAVLAILLMAGIPWRGGAVLAPSRFGKYSTAALAVSAGVASILVYWDMERLAELRAEYPFESMEGRLAGWTPCPGSDAFKPRAADRLFSADQMTSVGNYRAAMLRKLHESTAELFVDSPGFGAARTFRPSRFNLADRDPGPIPQPDPRESPGADGLADVPAETGRDQRFDKIHDESLFAFARSVGMAYQKDRQHVAGFVPHRLENLPSPVDGREVESIELVGLLRDHPRVYLSRNLPRMDELKDAPTRSLDPFELSALERLKAGEDFGVAQSDDALRMVGAIRASAQCVDCHLARHGDLLGAFSYRIKVGPSPAKSPPTETPPTETPPTN